MPSFVCDYCQETLKKAKLDQHAQRCRNACFSCIDCYKTFKGTDYRSHFSCITEVQKYHQKQPTNNNNTNTNTNNSTNSKPVDTPVSPPTTPVTAKKDKVDNCPLKKAVTELASAKKDLKPITLKVMKKHLKKSIGKKAAKKAIQEKIVFFINEAGMPALKLE